MTENTPGSSGQRPEESPQADHPAQAASGAGVPEDHQQSAGHQHAGAEQPHMTHPYLAGPYGQQWQDPGAYPPPMSAVHAPRRTATGSGRFVAGVATVAALAGLLGGGVGGFVGYQLGSSDHSGPTALDAPKPARSISTAPAGSVQQVAAKVLPSVAQLKIESVQGSGEGSGIVISQDGYILTNNHVAEGADSGRITAQFQDNRTAPVKVIGRDPNSDLAVVKADIAGLTPADIGRSDDLPVGAPVVAIGSPFGLSGTVTSGIISAKDRPVRAGGQQGNQSSVLNALQTDAAINPGNSGGPLVDMDGRVVGINSAIYSPGSGEEKAGSVGLGFAIPIDQAKRTAQELKATGSATQTTLGVQIVPVRGAPGAQVADVVPGGAAEKAGIRPGEVITRLNERPIPDPDTLIAAVRSHAPGDPVKIVLSQPGGGERTVDVVLAGQRTG